MPQVACNPRCCLCSMAHNACRPADPLCNLNRKGSHVTPVTGIAVRSDQQEKCSVHPRPPIAQCLGKAGRVEKAVGREVESQPWWQGASSTYVSTTHGRHELRGHVERTWSRDPVRRGPAGGAMKGVPLGTAQRKSSGYGLKLSSSGNFVLCGEGGGGAPVCCTRPLDGVCAPAEPRPTGLRPARGAPPACHQCISLACWLGPRLTPPCGAWS